MKCRKCGSEFEALTNSVNSLCVTCMNSEKFNWKDVMVFGKTYGNINDFSAGCEEYTGWDNHSINYSYVWCPSCYGKGTIPMGYSNIQNMGEKLILKTCPKCQGKKVCKGEKINGL